MDLTVSTFPLLYRTSKSTTLLFLVYYHVFKLKRGKSQKTIHLPPKEEGVCLEILDKKPEENLGF